MTLYTRNGSGANGTPRRVACTDPATGAVIDLTAWAGRFGEWFEVATALECRAPGILGGRVSGVKRHIECPFEAEHTSPGRDGTYAVDASAIGQAGLTRRTRGFYIDCSHNACAGRDRLDLLAGLLKRGWLTAADLTDLRFLAPANDPPDGSAVDLERARERVEALVERTREDPGAPFEPDNVVVLASLAKRDEAAYQRARDRLKRAGVRMRDLERAVQRARLRVIEGGAGADASGELRAVREAGPYLVTATGMTALRKETRDGPTIVPLATFTARIVAEEVHDDGAERRTVFAVEGALSGGRPLPRIEVPAERFAAMTWVAEQWGIGPVILAGLGTRDHFRTAVQMLSGAAPRRTVFGHLGWRRIDGVWLFLHAAGAIGARGAAADIEVEAGGERLAAYALPAPPEGEDLRRAVRASLDLLDLGPDAVTVAVLGATYRAPLGEAAPVDFALHLAGPTGAFKSELAALAQAHFRPAFSGRHLPASWADTANALEKKAFLAKDAVLVVDDFAPGGTTADVQRLHREADRLVRATGNRAGRARMAADGALRPTYFPRGLIVSTGEDVPAGQSLRARLLVVEVAPGAIRADRLTDAQGHAGAGRLAGAMAAYLQWLASRMDELKETLPERQRALRDEAVRGGVHRRTPEIVASLALGWDLFLEFAEAVGAVDAELLGRARAALGEAAGVQAAQQASEEPAARFLGLLRAALASGRAHLADPTTGREPAQPQRWGWREHTVGTGLYERREWVAQGERVGWLDGGDVLLQEHAAYAAAQRLARDQGTSLPVTPRTLWKRLAEQGLLASRDAARGTNTVRRTIGGERSGGLIHLRAGALMPETDQPDRADRGRGNPPLSDALGRSVSSPDGRNLTTETDQHDGRQPQENGGAGQDGQVGQFVEEGAGPWRTEL